MTKLIEDRIDEWCADPPKGETAATHSLLREAAEELRRLRGLVAAAREIIQDNVPGYTVWLGRSEEP